MRNKSRLRPVLIEFGAQLLESQIVAGKGEEPAQISIRVRDRGWAPYRVRFDEGRDAWVVSAFDSSNPPARGLKILNY